MKSETLCALQRSSDYGCIVSSTAVSQHNAKRGVLIAH